MFTDSAFRFGLVGPSIFLELDKLDRYVGVVVQAGGGRGCWGRRRNWQGRCDVVSSALSLNTLLLQRHDGVWGGLPLTLRATSFFWRGLRLLGRLSSLHSSGFVLAWLCLQER